MLLPTAASWTEPFTELWQKIVRDGPKWLIALCIVLVTWLVARLVGMLVRKVVARTSTQGHVDILIGRGASALVIALGVMVAFSEVGLSFGHALTALGLASVGLGFALKDILGNLFAGVMLLIQHPFTIGDQIRIGDHEGTVENVRVRDTQMITYDGKRVFVPNSTVFSNPIINYTSTPTLRRDVRFSIKRAEEVSAARDIAMGVLESNPAVAQQPAPLVLLEHDKDSIVLVLRFWSDFDRNRGLKLCSEITEELMEKLKSAGIRGQT